METIRFDDVEKLRSKVGREFSDWSEPIEVTENKISQFADATGDHQWIHIDIERRGSRGATKPGCWDFFTEFREPKQGFNSKRSLSFDRTKCEESNE
jgi:hypothetical protein